VNCSFCHQIHAGGTATIDLTHDVELDKAKLIDVRPSQGTFGLSDARLVAPHDPLASVLLYRISKTGGGRMPRVGSELVDEQAVAMIAEWIAQLPSPGGNQTLDVPAAQEIQAAEQQNREALALLAVQAGTDDQRKAALETLTSTTRGAFWLAQEIARGGIDGEARAQVLAVAAQHPQPEVRDLFERFVPASQRVQRLGTSVDAARLLAMTGSTDSGKELFFRDGTSTCKSCHKIAGQGIEIGPDLSQIGKKYPRAELLAHLLEPSKLIDPKYVPYVLETTEGKVLSGLLIEKTDEIVRLRDAKNEEVRIPAGEIELLVPQQKSLMPELLLRDLTPQQVADLIAYLSSLK
jgi:putative heme-binding domain-containing protein